MTGKGILYRIVSMLALLAVLSSSMGNASHVMAYNIEQSALQDQGPSTPGVALSQDLQRDAYFLNKLGTSSEPATDSASAGTAIATGYKTDDGNIAWKSGDAVDGKLITIAEKLRAEKGYAIGVASTVQFSHATPATFVSHNVSRNNYSQIADEIINSVKPEVVIGGGHPLYFSSPANYNYVGGQTNWNKLLQYQTPYTVVQRNPGVDGGVALKTAAEQVDLSKGQKLMGVFGGAGGNFEYNIPSDTPGAPSVARGSIENPTLADVTEASLDVLSQDDDGFFVMFEQGDIDWANHANHFSNMVGGVWDLDQAVQTVENYIKADGGPEWSDTLVIVTSDHSNSYLRLPYPLGKGDLPEQMGATHPNGEVTYRTGNHTNELVSLWARGAGASSFATVAGSWYPDTRIVDNTQIYQAMLDAANNSGAKHIILFIGDGMNIQHEIAASRYLYGEDFGLAWNEWGGLTDTWMGYAATWDVTTYNKYAASLGKPAYLAPAAPVTLGTNDALDGYDPSKGGTSPFTVESYPYLPEGAAADQYFLTKLGGAVPATDSASAGTAIATGYKTDDGNVAWKTGDLADGKLTTIAETLRVENDFAIGVASTVQFSHATPATFVSHNVSRNNYTTIANEIIDQVKPEVVIGGGHPLYYATPPNYNFVGGLATWQALLSGSTDYTVVRRELAKDGGVALKQAAANIDLAGGDKLMGVFGGVGGNFEYNIPSDTPGVPSVARGSIENPTLADVTEVSLDVLSQDPDGFFVMFEQGDIDWANHASSFKDLVGSMWDLDQAVRATEEYINADGGPDWSDTLVIVTSDHSNSYMRLPKWLGKGDLPAQSGKVYPDGEVWYGVDNSHTNELVTLWALGQGASLFNDYAGSWYPNSRIVDNSQIYSVMLRAVKEAGVKHVILFIGDGMNIEHEIAASRYLYGTNMDLAWHDWRLNPNGWAGYAATWDVTTYNRYAASLGQPAYVAPTMPAALGSNIASVGYDPEKGGYAPFQLQSNYALLSMTPGYLYKELDAGATTTANVTFGKVGPVNPAWTLSDDAGWLSAATSSGRLILDTATVNVTLNFNAAGLAPAFYRTDLTLDTLVGTVTIPVVLKVKASGAAPAGTSQVVLNFLNSYKTNANMGSEISAYDPTTHYVYVTNGSTSKVDVLDITNIETAEPNLVKSLDISAYGAEVTSVDVFNGLAAVAVPAPVKTDNGHVVFFQGSDAPVAVEVGALPDMLTFTKDGQKVLVANEGEPNADYSVDPNGTISIIDLSQGLAQATAAHLDFSAFTKDNLDPKVRIYGPNASVAQDMEPEYITVSEDGKNAWVTLQENNAIAFIDLTVPEITKVVALGFKDWSQVNGLDASDRDPQGTINITNWPVFGMYQPDGIASYLVNGQTYLITANEGDARDYGAAYAEEARVGSLNLDPTAFPHAAEMKNNAALGRLNVTKAGSNIGSSYVADPDQDGDIDKLFTLGGRSFSIWNGTTGELVYDSGDAFERIIAQLKPEMFNADSGLAAQKDTRSDNKGPEPESVVVAPLFGKVFAFIALERATGGVMIYDVTDPQTPAFVALVPAAAGDISPEGLKFIPASQSPTHRSLLVMSNELSGSTSVFEVMNESKGLFLKMFMPLVNR